MNSILARVLGEDAADAMSGVLGDDPESDPSPPPPAARGPRTVPPVREDVPVPVAAMPRTSFRDRLQRRRAGKDEKSAVRRVMGEAAEDNKEEDDNNDSLIPADAEKLDGVGDTIRKGVKPLKDVVMEPRDPYGEKERLMSPSSALVAPDCTPDANKPLPPSGAGNPAGRFRSREADQEPEGGGEGHPGSALDTVLSRAKAPLPREPDVVGTVESAYKLLGVQSPGAQHLAENHAHSSVTGATLLAEGQTMPEHVHTDGKAVLDAFRRFNR